MVDSGGGLNVYWCLDAPCANLESIESINQQVRDLCEADHCWNIDRIMRLPGTVNWPDSRKRARGRSETLAKIVLPFDGVVYEPHKLSASFPPPKAQAPSPAAVAINMPSQIAAVTPDDLGLSALDPIRLAIAEPPGTDRSGDGVAAARLMANAGYGDADILGVLLNPANAVSAHYLAQRDPKRAAARTLQLVRADTPAPDDTEAPPVMSKADFDRFVSNMRAKAAQDMTPDAFSEEAPVTLAQPEQPAPVWGGGAEPTWLTDLGDNPIAGFVRHVCNSALSPQPWVTLGAALTVFGTLAGRRYAGPTGLRTNIYAIGICDSGGGKDHPIKSATDLMIKSGYQAKLGGSKIASGQAMLTDLAANPALLYAIDEVGFLISSAADRKRAPKHATEIIDNLTALYSMAGSTFLGTSYADQSESGGKPRKVIEQPCLSLFGVTTPNVFWGSLSSSNVMDGSLARMVIFQSENDYPDRQYDAVRGGMPETLIEAAKTIVSGARGHNALPLGEGATQAPKPYSVRYADEEAKAKAIAMSQHETNLLRTHKGTANTSIIARMAENAAKMALIRAIAANPAHPVLTRADLVWGVIISKKSVDSLMAAVKEKVADNENEAKLKRLLSLIKAAGDNGLAHEKLHALARFMGSRRAMNDALDFLAESGDIQVVVVEADRADGKKANKPRRTYVAIG
jgi:hypothetical protein